MLQAAVLAPSHLCRALYVFSSVSKLGIPCGREAMSIYLFIQALLIGF